MRTKKNIEFSRFIKSNPTPGEIEAYLIDLEEATDEEAKFWDDYWSYLAKEREKRLQDITEALEEAKSDEGSFPKCSRIVSATFANDPLCTIGSIKIASNRFNFGNISPSIASFQALYLGKDFPTAYLEKYGHELGVRLGERKYDPSILKAQPGGFTHVEADVFLESFIDLRKIDKLQSFVNVVKEIEIPQSFSATAKKLFGKSGKLTTISTAVNLKRALMYREHAQWPTLLDQPSNPQWFGHYVKEAGISGIVYPSVKNKFGFNIVLYPDNLKDSSTTVSLTNQWPNIPKDRQYLNAKNYHLMQFPPGPATPT